MPRAHPNRNSIFGLIADSVRLGVAEAEIRCGLPDEDRWQTLVASVALKNVDVPRSRDATSSGVKYGGLPRGFSAVRWDHDPTAYDRNEFEASGSRLQWTMRRGMVQSSASIPPIRDIHIGSYEYPCANSAFPRARH